MSISIASVLVIVGLVALTLGADALVRGSSRLATHFGVSPLIVGLTVVAYGTSAPEMVASVVAALEGHASVTIGNVLGSNVANTGLILGGTALFTPLLVAPSILRRELPILIGVTLFFALLALRLELGRLAGFGFIGFLAYVNYLSFRWAQKSRVVPELPENAGNGALWRNVALTAAGLALLLGGAHMLVEGAVALARIVGLSDFVIGVTLVAVGTSLPELATSFIAGLRKEAELVVGNIVGSNLFNILGALGLSAAIRPLEIDPELLGFEIPALVVFTIAMAVFLHTGARVVRSEGVALLLGYVGFIAWVL